METQDETNCLESRRCLSEFWQKLGFQTSPFDFSDQCNPFCVNSSQSASHLVFPTCLLSLGNPNMNSFVKPHLRNLLLNWILGVIGTALPFLAPWN